MQNNLISYYHCRSNHQRTRIHNNRIMTHSIDRKIAFEIGFTNHHITTLNEFFITIYSAYFNIHICIYILYYTFCCLNRYFQCSNCSNQEEPKKMDTHFILELLITDNLNKHTHTHTQNV